MLFSGKGNKVLPDCMNSLQMRDLIKKVGNTDEFVLFRVRLRGIERNDTKVEMLWHLYRLAKYTDMFSDDVRDFLFFEDKDYKDISNKYGISEGNLKNRIFRQMKKFSEAIGSNLYKDVLDGNINEEECFYIIEDLKELYNKREKVVKTIDSYFYEDILSGRNLTRDFSDLDDGDYMFARDVISRLSIPATHVILDNLDDELKDYIAYLIVTPLSRLTDRDKERKENLLSFLKIEDAN